MNIILGYYTTGILLYIEERKESFSSHVFLFKVLLLNFQIKEKTSHNSTSSYLSYVKCIVRSTALKKNETKQKKKQTQAQMNVDGTCQTNECIINGIEFG